MSWADVNWEAISAIGQMLGALGVILSLIYVGLQVRADAKARRAQTLHDTGETIGDVTRSMAENEDLIRLWMRGTQDLDQLSTLEFVRLNFLLTGIFLSHQSAYHQYRLGYLDPSVWRGIEAVLDRQLSAPGIRDWWQTGASQSRTAEFRALVDAKIAEKRPTMPLDFRRPASGRAVSDAVTGTSVGGEA